MLPGTEMVPPMTSMDLARITVVGAWEAARARFVSGPMAMIVMVSGGFSSRIRKISRCDGRCDGIKSDVRKVGSISTSCTAAEVRRVSDGGALNRSFQISSAGVW